MIRILGILALLSILALPGSSSDYLEGGYVGSYSGDAGKYFTDPIFMMKVGAGATSAPSSAYASKPVSPLGSTGGQTTIGRYSASNTPVPKSFSSTPCDLDCHQRSGGEYRYDWFLWKMGPPAL